MRDKIARKPSSVRLGTVAATPDTVSLIADIFCGGWRTWGAVMGIGGGGRLGALDGCASPAGSAFVGCLQSRGERLILLSAVRCSLSAWAWISAMEDARAWILSMILSISIVPDPGISFSASSSKS